LTSSGAGKLVVLAAALGTVTAAVIRSRRPEARNLRIWLHRCIAGTLAVAAAYVMFLGSGLFPLTYPGLDDRVQTFAVFGFVVASYSLLALVAQLVGGHRRHAALAILGVGTILVVAGFIQRVRADVRDYDAAAASQRYFLARVHSALPQPRHGETIFTFGYPAQSAPGVPIFRTSWELAGALELRWDDRTLRAFPVYRRNVRCTDGAVSARLAGIDTVAPYRRAVFVDVPTARIRVVGSHAACVRALT